MEQVMIPFITKRDEITDEAILRCKNSKAAIRLMIEVSGLPLKDVACHLGLNENHLSRMLSDNEEDKRHFPLDLLDKAMGVCGNEIPLRWQNLKRGYGMHRLKSSLEIENEALKAELEKARHEKEVIIKALKEVRS